MNFEDIKPHVPEVLSHQASPVEKFLLESQSVNNQQAAFMIKRIEEIVRQTTITNGRVSSHDIKLEELAETHDYVTRLRRNWRFIAALLAIFAPVMLGVVNRLLELWIK